MPNTIDPNSPQFRSDLDWLKDGDLVKGYNASDAQPSPTGDSNRPHVQLLENSIFHKRIGSDVTKVATYGLAEAAAIAADCDTGSFGGGCKVTRIGNSIA